MVVRGCGWLWVVVGGCGWLWVVLDDCGCLWVVVDGCGWLWIVVDGSGWFWMVVGGCILYYNPLTNTETVNSESNVTLTTEELEPLKHGLKHPIHPLQVKRIF